jgi:hypothetical protein
MVGRDKATAVTPLPTSLEGLWRMRKICRSRIRCGMRLRQKPTGADQCKRLAGALSRGRARAPPAGRGRMRCRPLMPLLSRLKSRRRQVWAPSPNPSPNAPLASKKRLAPLLPPITVLATAHPLPLPCWRPAIKPRLRRPPIKSRLLERWRVSTQAGTARQPQTRGVPWRTMCGPLMRCPHMQARAQAPSGKTVPPSPPVLCKRNLLCPLQCLARPTSEARPRTTPLAWWGVAKGTERLREATHHRLNRLPRPSPRTWSRVLTRWQNPRWQWRTKPHQRPQEGMPQRYPRDPRLETPTWQGPRPSTPQRALPLRRDASPRARAQVPATGEERSRAPQSQRRSWKPAPRAHHSRKLMRRRRLGLRPRARPPPCSPGKLVPADRSRRARTAT